MTGDQLPVTLVHLLRHGEVHNPDRILYGRLPGFELSELGGKMADLVADCLGGRDVTYLMSSPLERTRQTAEPLAARLGLPVVTDRRLIESGNAFQGLRPVGGSLFDPRHWYKLRDPFRPSWGEGYRNIARRMWAAVGVAREAASGHEAVCVSHQLPIWTLRRALTRQPLWHDPRRRECALASVTTLRFVGSRVSDVTYAEPAAELAAYVDPQAKGA